MNVVKGHLIFRLKEKTDRQVNNSLQGGWQGQFVTVLEGDVYIVGVNREIIDRPRSKLPELHVSFLSFMIAMSVLHGLKPLSDASKALQKIFNRSTQTS